MSLPSSPELSPRAAAAENTFERELADKKLAVEEAERGRIKAEEMKE